MRRDNGVPVFCRRRRGTLWSQGSPSFFSISQYYRSTDQCKTISLYSVYRWGLISERVISLEWYGSNLVNISKGLGEKNSSSLLTVMDFFSPKSITSFLTWTTLFYYPSNVDHGRFLQEVFNWDIKLFFLLTFKKDSRKV